MSSSQFLMARRIIMLAAFINMPMPSAVLVITADCSPWAICGRPVTSSTSWRANWNSEARSAWLFGMLKKVSASARGMPGLTLCQTFLAVRVQSPLAGSIALRSSTAWGPTDRAALSSMARKLELSTRCSPRIWYGTP